MGRVAVFICAALLLLSQHRAAAKNQLESKATVHTVITTECSPYFDWQILGLVYRSVPPFLAGNFITMATFCTPLSFLPAHAQLLVLLAAQLQAGEAAGQLHAAAELHRGAAERVQGAGPGPHTCGAQSDNGPQQRTQRPLFSL